MNKINVVIGITIIVIVIWLVLPSVLYFIFPASNIASSERGQFGDMYGVLTSLFSGLTMIGLVYTIIQQQEDLGIARTSLAKQHEELELNREELQLNREELKETRKEFIQQNKTLRLQRFENTFFNMIKLHTDIVNSFEKNERSFLYYYNRSLTVLTPYQSLNEMRRGYHSILSAQVIQIYGHYISNFELVLRFVIKRKKKTINQDTYLKIYFAQLSIYEKIFLYYFYNLTEKPEFWNRVKRLLFEHITAGHLAQPMHTNILDGIPVK